MRFAFALAAVILATVNAKIYFKEEFSDGGDGFNLFIISFHLFQFFYFLITFNRFRYE